MWLPQNISSNIAETMLVDAVRTFSQSMEQAVDNAIAFAEKEARRHPVTFGSALLLCFQVVLLCVPLSHPQSSLSPNRHNHTTT